MLPLLKQSKTKPKLFFERIIKRMGSVKCDKTLNVPIGYKGKGNGSSKYQCELAVAYETNLYYYKTLILCLSVPDRLENHLMKLDILWHTVSLGF